MESVTLFRCQKCGHFFEDEQQGDKHEESCVPLEAGQRVRFAFRLLSFEGVITHISTPQEFMDEIIVYIKADQQVDDPDWLRGYDGKHVWVVRSNVLEVIAGD